MIAVINHSQEHLEFYKRGGNKTAIRWKSKAKIDIEANQFFLRIGKITLYFDFISGNPLDLSMKVSSVETKDE